MVTDWFEWVVVDGVDGAAPACRAALTVEALEDIVSLGMECFLGLLLSLLRWYEERIRQSLRKSVPAERRSDGGEQDILLLGR